MSQSRTKTKRNFHTLFHTLFPYVMQGTTKERNPNIMKNMSL